jgi:hypothetical protein
VNELCSRITTPSSVFNYNSVVDWYPSDSADMFEQNKLEFEKKSGITFPWDETSIKYRINSHGFRGDDFEPIEGESFIALGCSMTFGVGIKEEQTWVSRLSEQLGIHGYNLGAPGQGFETFFRVLSYWLPILKSKTVFVYINPGVRREWFNANANPSAFHTMGAWHHDLDHYTEHEFEMFMNQTEASVAKARALYAIKGICEQYGATVVMLECERDEVIEGLTQANGVDIPVGAYNDNTVDPSRDIIHPGPIFNERLAESFASFYGD